MIYSKCFLSYAETGKGGGGGGETKFFFAKSHLYFYNISQPHHNIRPHPIHGVKDGRRGLRNSVCRVRFALMRRVGHQIVGCNEKNVMSHVISRVMPADFTRGSTQYQIK